MRYILTLLCFLNFFFYSYAQTRTLSEESEISVLTMGPGNYFYDKFGHSAIRVQDKNSGLDIVFNYGIFDFNTPNFYSKFARGKLLYSLGLANFEDFYQYYKSEDRWITEQVLNLNIAQKREVFQLLVENAKPENKDYLYDFTYDNCATKIRDILSLALATDLKYNTEQEEKEKSFRQLIGEKLHSNTWGSLGIDLALGAEIDKKVSKWEYQFLPDYVLEANAEAKVKINLEWQPLVKETKKLYKQQDEKKNTGFFLSSPWVVFSLLGLGLIWFTRKDRLQKKRTKAIDIFVFTFTGILGAFILFLWFGTDHLTTKYNYNILWAFPINLLFLITISKDLYNKRLINYLNLLSILIFLLFFHWITGVQKYPYPILPLCIGMFVRYRYLVSYYKSKPELNIIDN